MILEDGEKALLHLRVDENLTIPRLVETTLGIGSASVEIMGIARRDGIVEATESPRPHLFFGNEVIRTAFALQIHALRIEHRKGVVFSKRLDILRIAGASVTTCARCHRANYTGWNVLHTILFFDFIIYE